MSKSVVKDEEFKVADFFTKWFHISIILVLIGIVIQPSPSSIGSYLSFQALGAKLLESIGVAMFVANIFTYMLGTKQFVSYIRNKLIGIVVSKEFITKLDEKEQKQLLRMTLKPEEKLSKVYSGIEDYFEKYIDNSVNLFQGSYRGRLIVDAVASYNEEKRCVQVLWEIDYAQYKVAGNFDPIPIQFEDERSKHLETIIETDGGLKKVINSDSLESMEDIIDPCMKKGYLIKIPDEFQKCNHINVSRKFIEYGSDHWQVFSYKTLTATHKLIINLRCKGDLRIKDANTYGTQKNFSVEKSDKDKKIKISNNNWLSPGFGVTAIVAEDNYHITLESEEKGDVTL